MMMSIRFLIMLVFLLPLYLQGQKEGNIWCFGFGAGIDFNSSPPVAYTHSRMSVYEGCSSMCDSAGNLLFYTDGDTIWSGNHQVMVNGTGLPAEPSSVQAVLAVRQPNTHLYYIFTTDDVSSYYYGNNAGFCYSIVDMDANGGKGAVILKNKQLFKNVGEQVAGIKDESKVWIASRQLLSDSIFLYRLDSKGITRVFPLAGLLTTQFVWGQMKFSPDGKTLICIDAYQKTVYIYDFDMSSGKLSNLRHIRDIPYVWSIEFSPSSAYVYFYSPGEVYQFKMDSLDSDRVAGDALFINKVNFNGDVVMQLGPDNRIYFSNMDQSKLPVINFPDNPGPAYGFVVDGIDLGGKKSWSGLPEVVRALRLNEKLWVGDPNCFRGSTMFILQNSRADSIRWIFGDGESVLSGKDSIKHLYKTAGLYSAIVVSYHANRTDTFRQQVSMKSIGASIRLETDTSDCHNVVLSVPDQKGYSYGWSTGDTIPRIKVSTDGIYSLIIRDSLCRDSSGIQVAISAPPQADLGKDTFLCSGAVELKTKEQGKYLWSNTATSPSIRITTPGQYWLQVSRNNCTDSDTIEILSCEALRYYIPDAFSPNGDFINDVFSIHGQNIKALQLSIYNRWGEKIYETSSAAASWDGTYRGELCEEGVYFYTLDIVGFKDGSSEFINGTLTLLR